MFASPALKVNQAGQVNQAGKVDAVAILVPPSSSAREVFIETESKIETLGGDKKAHKILTPSQRSKKGRTVA